MKAVGTNVLATKKAGSGPTTTASGLYIPEVANDTLIVSGIVTSVGEGIDCGVTEGDVVFFNKHGAFSIKGDAGEFYVVRQSEILAKE